MPVITDEERYMFDLQGFLVVRGALSTEEVAEMRSVVDPLVERHLMEISKDSGGASTVRLDGLIQRDVRFAKMIDHPVLLSYVKEFVPVPQTVHSWTIHKFFDAAPQAWHLGIHPADYQFRTLMDGTEHRRICTRMLNSIIMLTDNNPGDGCAAVLPASHKSNYTPDWRFFKPELTQPGSIEVTGKAGDVIFFSEALMHAGLRKTTQGVRANLYFNFVDSNFGFTGLGGWDQIKQHWFPPELRAQLTPGQRALTRWMEVINPPTGK